MIDLSPVNTKNEPHGFWRYMITPQVKAYEGYYYNGERIGLWITFSHDKCNNIILKKYILK